MCRAKNISRHLKEIGSKNFGINGIDYKLINRKYSYENAVRREKVTVLNSCLLKN